MGENGYVKLDLHPGLFIDVRGIDALLLRAGSEDLAHTYQLMGSITKHGDIDPYNGAKVAMRCKQAETVRTKFRMHIVGLAFDASLTQLARNGHFDTAVATLLSEIMHPERTNFTVRDVQTWQRGIYAILRIQALRRSVVSLSYSRFFDCRS